MVRTRYAAAGGPRPRKAGVGREGRRDRAEPDHDGGIGDRPGWSPEASLHTLTHPTHPRSPPQATPITGEGRSYVLFVTGMGPGHPSGPTRAHPHPDWPLR